MRFSLGKMFKSCKKYWYKKQSYIKTRSTGKFKHFKDKIIYVVMRNISARLISLEVFPWLIDNCLVYPYI